MTLKEMSQFYEDSAMLLRCRIHHLRKALRSADDPEERFQLQRRISQLTPILSQMTELAELTAHYYDRGYCRNGKYTL